MSMATAMRLAAMLARFLKLERFKRKTIIIVVIAIVVLVPTARCSKRSGTVGLEWIVCHGFMLKRKSITAKFIYKYSLLIEKVIAFL
jgi:hypothetical protein